MNKGNQAIFKKITDAAQDYRVTVRVALEKYRADAEHAKLLKDETGYMAAAKTNARNRIDQAEKSFRKAVSDQLPELKKELRQHLATRPNPGFLDALRVYSDFGIVPTRSDVEALVDANGGNPLGLRALNRVLEKTGAKFRVNAPDSAQYEADLKALDHLANREVKYSQNELHTELAAIYKGTPRLQYRPDGSSFDSGYKWDGTGLLISSNGFESAINSLAPMAERWSAAMLPDFDQIQNYEPTTDPDTGEKISAARQFADDYRATKDAAAVTEDGAGIEQAKAIAEKNAENTATYNKVMEHYGIGRA